MSKLTDKPAASTPLSASDLLALWQGKVPKQIDLATLVGIVPADIQAKHASALVKVGARNTNTGDVLELIAFDSGFVLLRPNGQPDKDIEYSTGNAFWTVNTALRVNRAKIASEQAASIATGTTHTFTTLPSFGSTAFFRVRRTDAGVSWIADFWHGGVNAKLPRSGGSVAVGDDTDPGGAGLVRLWYDGGLKAHNDTGGDVSILAEGWFP